MAAVATSLVADVGAEGGSAAAAAAAAAIAHAVTGSSSPSGSICQAALDRARRDGPRSLPGELRELPSDYGADGMCPYHRYLPADYSEGGHAAAPAAAVVAEASDSFKHSSSLTPGDVQRQLPKPERMKDIVRYKGPTSQKTVQKQAATNAGLQAAVQRGDADAVAGILKFGLARRCVNVCAPLWPKRETMLHLAARRNDREVCVMLLEAKAELDAEEITDGRLPLHDACANGSFDVAELLLDNRARLEDGTLTGMRPLHWAAAGGHAEVVDLLLDRRAQQESTSGNSQQALHHAAAKGHGDVVRLLCKRGAKVDTKTFGGQRALQLACLGGHVKAAAALLDYCALNVLEDLGEGGPLQKWRDSPLEELLRLVETLRMQRDEAEELQDMGQTDEAHDAFQRVVEGYLALGLAAAAATAHREAAECGVDL